MITRRNNPTVLEGNDVDVVLNKSITPFITRALFVFILLFVIQFKLKAQLSKVHYIPPIAYSENGNAIPNQGHYLYLSTPSTSSVTVNVIAVGGATTSLEVSNSIPRVFVIDAPGGADDSQVAIAANDDVAITTSQVISNKGYIVEATSEIYVALRIGQDAQAGALVSKGGAALGTDFRVGAFTHYNISYHSGSNPEPSVGDHIIYNTNYFFPHALVFDKTNYAFLKLRDYNKIVEVRKSDGEIVAIYDYL